MMSKNNPHHAWTCEWCTCPVRSHPCFSRAVMEDMLSFKFCALQPVGYRPCPYFLTPPDCEWQSASYRIFESSSLQLQCCNASNCSSWDHTHLPSCQTNYWLWINELKETYNYNIPTFLWIQSVRKEELQWSRRDCMCSQVILSRSHRNMSMY